MKKSTQKVISKHSSITSPITDAERTAHLARARAESEAALAKMDADVQAHIASENASPQQPKSEQARIADVPPFIDTTAMYKAPLNSNRPFNIMR